MKAKIKNFFKNLGMTLKVQKGALNRVAAELVFKLVIIAAALALAIISNITPVIVVVAIISAGALFSTLSILRHDYKKVVADAADVVIKRSNKAGYIARKKAEKASKKAQDKDVEARKIEEKYK